MTAKSHAQPAASRQAKILSISAAALAAVAAGYSGVHVGGSSKIAVVLPIAIGVAALVGALALTRFSAYVFLMLVLRASIDLAKVSGPSAGNTVTDAATSRLLDPSTMLAVLFLVAAALWLTAQYVDAGRLPGSSLRRAFAIFALAGLASISASTRPLVSAAEALRILAVVMMFAVLERLMSNGAAIRKFLLAAFLSTVFPLLYTLVRFAIGNPATEVKGDFTRLTGPFSQSNTFGRYLMLFVIFGVALYPHVSRRVRVMMGGGIVLASLFLMMTYTRTAAIGAVAGLLVVGWLQSKRVLLFLVAVVLCGLVALPQLSSRYSSLTDTTAAGPNAPTGNSLVWRFNFWTDVLPLANRNPVTGIGLAMTQYETANEKQPHNDFIRAYVETGIVGLGAYIALLGVLIATGRRAINASARGTFERGVAVGFTACAVAFTVVSAAANVMSNVVSLWYLATFAAAASAVVRCAATPTTPTPSARRGREQWRSSIT